MYASIRIALAAAALALAAPAAAAEAEYVPFVTDFPRAVSPAGPDVTAADDSSPSFHWESAGVGVAVGLGAGALVGLLGLTRRRTAMA